MSASVLYMSMSLDGYIAGSNDKPGNPGGDGFDRIRKIFLNGRCRSFGRGSSREVAQRNRFYRAILVIPTINTTNVSNPAPILCAHNAAPTAPAKPKTIVYVSQSNERRFCGSSVTLVTHLSLVEMLDTIEHHPS
jgi:hypothetical protein